jgi:transcriptional regulator with XRE-family HTH domain
MDEKTLDLIKLGHRIRFLRNGKGWSLSLLEKESGVSKAYISDVENGAAGRPNIQYVYSLAIALGVSLDDLFDETKRKISGSRTKIIKSDLPHGLLELQRELNLTDEDVDELSRVNFRGSRPRDKEGWRFLLEAIKRASHYKPGE